jgi:hypothetical protein
MFIAYVLRSASIPQCTCEAQRQRSAKISEQLFDTHASPKLAVVNQQTLADAQAYDVLEVGCHKLVLEICG